MADGTLERLSTHNRHKENLQKETRYRYTGDILGPQWLSSPGGSSQRHGEKQTHTQRGKKQVTHAKNIKQKKKGHNPDHGNAPDREDRLWEPTKRHRRLHHRQHAASLYGSRQQGKTHHLTQVKIEVRDAKNK